MATEWISEIETAEHYGYPKYPTGNMPILANPYALFGALKLSIEERRIGVNCGYGNVYENDVDFNNAMQDAAIWINGSFTFREITSDFLIEIDSDIDDLAKKYIDYDRGFDEGEGCYYCYEGIGDILKKTGLSDLIPQITARDFFNIIPRLTPQLIIRYCQQRYFALKHLRYIRPCDKSRNYESQTTYYCFVPEIPQDFLTIDALKRACCGHGEEEIRAFSIQCFITCYYEYRDDEKVYVLADGSSTRDITLSSGAFGGVIYELRYKMYYSFDGFYDFRGKFTEGWNIWKGENLDMIIDFSSSDIMSIPLQLPEEPYDEDSRGAEHEAFFLIADMKSRFKFCPIHDRED